ncbi:histidine ammonia-lyase, partial [Vibrio parahaemolyticus EKP-028]
INRQSESKLQNRCCVKKCRSTIKTVTLHPISSKQTHC